LSSDQGLLEAVHQFAIELEDLFSAVFGERGPSFDVERAPAPGSDGTTRFVIRPPSVEVQRGAPSSSIPLFIDGERALAMDVAYRCRWDHAQRYLAVDSATWSVRSVDVAEPLFRYEFVSRQGDLLPAAHLHVHAHRDELVYTLFRGGVGRPRSRGQAILTRKGLPRLSNIHFPLGGDRLRPCLEDVLQMLIEEFSIEHEAGLFSASNRAGPSGVGIR